MKKRNTSPWCHGYFQPSQRINLFPIPMVKILTIKFGQCLITIRWHMKCKGVNMIVRTELHCKSKGPTISIPKRDSKAHIHDTTNITLYLWFYHFFLFQGIVYLFSQGINN